MTGIRPYTNGFHSLKASLKINRIANLFNGVNLFSSSIKHKTKNKFISFKLNCKTLTLIVYAASRPPPFV